MDLNEYQKNAYRTAMYPGVGEGSALALSYLGLGLGEAGEVQGKIKKILRDDSGTVSPEKANDIAAELGDVLWYVALMANELGFELDEVANNNLKKLASRQERGVLTGSGDNR